jgi:predicted ATPase
VDLLERDGALATLAEAYDAAARGDGRVVFVTGEPGIGKSSLVARFRRDVDAGARVLLGTCDDLSISAAAGSGSRPCRERLAGARASAFGRRIAS